MSALPWETVTGATRRRVRTALAVGLSLLMLVSAIAAVAAVPARGATTTAPTTIADQSAPATALWTERSSTASTDTNATVGDGSHRPRTSQTVTQVTAEATRVNSSVFPDQPGIKWGGRTIAVDVHPEDPSIALAASESGGLFKTTDGGTTWTHLGGVRLPHRLSDVKFAPSNPDVVILSAHADSRRLRMDDRTLSGGGIWRSTDGGDTWNKPASGEPPASFPCAGNATTQAIAFEPNTTNVYVGTECGLAISHDLGATWEHVRVGPGRENLSVSTVISPAEGIVDIGTAGTGHYRYNTTSGTWQANNLPASFVWNSPSSLAASPADPDVLFAVVQERDRSCGTNRNISRTLYQSDDGGKNWSMVNYPDRCIIKRSPFVVTPPVATNGSFDVFVGNGDETFRQEDCSGTGGPGCENATSAWSKVSVDHPDQIDIAYPADDPCPLFMANDGGVERTTDCGATWHNVGNSSKRGGYNALQLYQVSGQIWPDHTDLYVGTQDNSIWASPDGGATWPNSHSNEGGWLSLARYGTDHDNETITGEAEAGQFQSKPHLESAGPWPNPPNISAGSSLGSKPYFVEEGVYLQWSGETDGNRTLWLTNDTGSTWREVITLRGPAIRGNPVVGPPDDPTMYVPYDRSSGIGLYRITNIRGPGAANATEVAGEIGSLAIHVRGQGTFDFRRVVEADPNDPDHVMTVDADAEVVKVSHDGGRTWETDGELTNLVTDGGRYEMIYGSDRGSNEKRRTRNSQVTAIAFDPRADSDRILVGTEDSGIIASEDGGEGWYRLEGSKRVSAVTSFFFDDRTGNDTTRNVYASTYGRGLWEIDPIRGIGGCTRIDDPGRYHLTENLTVRNDQPCFEINASGVAIDGNGFTLRGSGDGSGDGYPVVAHNFSSADLTFNDRRRNLEGVTVRDLRVANWSQSVYFRGVNHTTVRDVRVVDGFDVAGTSSGRGVLYFRGEDHDVIDAAVIDRPGRGIDFSDAREIEIRGTTVENSGGQGILVDKAADVTIENSTVVGGESQGIQLGQTDRARLLDNAVRSNANNGLLIEGTTRGRIADNTVTGNAGYGIRVRGRISEDNAVVGNLVAGNGGVGIQLRESPDSSLEGNTVRRSGSHGILVNAVGSAVRDNTVRSNAGEGVLINGVSNVTMAGNVVANHTGGSVGIQLDGDVDGFRAIGNVVRGNDNGILVNAYATGDVAVRGNQFVDNAESGVWVSALASTGAVEVHYNRITGNGAYGVENGRDDATVNATHNWWGTATGPASPDPAGNLTDPVTGALTNGTGDTITENGSNAGVSNVRFDPWVSAGFGYANLSVTPPGLVAGQSVAVSADVTNPANVTRAVRVPLLVDGAVRDTETLTLGPGETTTVRFTRVLPDSGVYTLTIGAATPVDVSVDPAWYQFKATPGQTGKINTTGPTTPVGPRWTFETRGEVETSPAVVNGTVYVGSAEVTDGYLYAFDARTGAVRWNVSTSGVPTSPAVFNGTVYTATAAGLYALDARTGATRWRFDPRFIEFESSPTVVGGTVYVGSNDGRVYAVDARTGAERWNTTTNEDVRSSPAVANGTVFVGDDAGNLYALNATTGAVRWNVSLIGKARSSPGVSGGTVYVGSGEVDAFEPTNGSVYAINATTGAIRWNFSTNGGVWSSPAVADGAVFVGTSDVGKSLYALDARTGAVRWNFTPRFGGGVGTAPAVADGVVYVRSPGSIGAFDADSGRVLWEYGEFWEAGSAAVMNGTVYVGAGRGRMNALHADTVSPTIDDASLVDATDGDGSVSGGDRIAITANVSDDGAGVDRVGANASAFGAGIVELTDADEDGVYNATVVVDASRAAADGSYAVTVAANDTANNTVTASTNDLEIARAADPTPTATPTATDTRPVSGSASGLGPLGALLALLVVALLALRRR